MGKQKINRLLILLLVAVLIGSCTKSKQDTTIEFVIRNPANGKPFAGVPVKIEEEHAGNSGITGNTIFTGVTGVDGKIRYTFKAKKGSGYWYYPYIDESYFGGTYGVDWSYLARPEVSSYAMKKDQYNEALYEIVFYAYLKEKIKNVNCEGNTDTLIYHAWTPQFPGGGGAYNKNLTFLGCFDFETTGTLDGTPDGYRRVFMGWYKIDWECHRPSGITYGVDSIWLDQGQTGTMELLY